MSQVRYKKYEIRQGDTIQMIAQQELGDMSQWPFLASVNNLKWPYIVGTEAEKSPNANVAVYGDTLVIPQDTDLSTINQNSLSTPDRDIITAYALGKDLDLLADSSELVSRGNDAEIVSLTDDGGGRLKTTEGYKNLVQAIVMVLNTPKGSYPIHPDYGNTFGDMLGKPNNYKNAVIIQTMIEKTVKLDSRVQTCTVEIEGIHSDTLKFSITVTPVSFESQLKMIIEMDNTGTFSLVN